MTSASPTETRVASVVVHAPPRATPRVAGTAPGASPAPRWTQAVNLHTQCLVDAGVCDCTKVSVALGLSTTCSVTNEHGSCPGQRGCAEGGLTECDAPAPAQETCNGKDDDCDDDSGETGQDAVSAGPRGEPAPLHASGTPGGLATAREFAPPAPRRARDARRTAPAPTTNAAWVAAPAATLRPATVATSPAAPASVTTTRQRARRSDRIPMH